MLFWVQIIEPEVSWFPFCPSVSLFICGVVEFMEKQFFPQLMEELAKNAENIFLIFFKIGVITSYLDWLSVEISFLSKILFLS